MAPTTPETKVPWPFWSCMLPSLPPFTKSAPYMSSTIPAHPPHNVEQTLSAAAPCSLHKILNLLQAMNADCSSALQGVQAISNKYQLTFLTKRDKALCKTRKQVAHRFRRHLFRSDSRCQRLRLARSSLLDSSTDCPSGLDASDLFRCPPYIPSPVTRNTCLKSNASSHDTTAIS